ncbi:hypothetical protein ROHU_016919 [Labeo rohita]|uniref:Uncharacterized protein n=1 Tax=Labeo rohita TaxID=84645 RepID=A0A498NIE8_LABRO|nr:hypothetical protein ROHU_016919 [Labeo rohita]
MESYRCKQTGPRVFQSLGLDWEADQEESNLIRGESLLQSSFTCWQGCKAAFGLSVKGLRPAEGGGYANESVARGNRVARRTEEFITFTVTSC